MSAGAAPPNLSVYPWFVPGGTQQSNYSRLINSSVGTFLVRPSRTPGAYTVEVRTATNGPGAVTSMRLVWDPARRLFHREKLPGDAYATLSELLASLPEITTEVGGEGVYVDAKVPGLWGGAPGGEPTSAYANVDPLTTEGSGRGSRYERMGDVIYESLSDDCPLIGLKGTAVVTFGEALAEAAAATGADFTLTMAKSFDFATSLVDRGRSRGLKVDEVAVINIYTHDKPEKFYRDLNAAMGGYTPRKHKDLPGYLPFIRLLLSAMFKLEHVAALVWRGVRGTPAALLGGADKGPGDEVTWWTFTSTTLSADVTKAFIEGDGPRVMFRIQVAAGVQIGSFSDFRGVEAGMESEQEVIVLPGTRFAIDAVHELGGGLTEVRMHEVVGGYSTIEAALSERRPAAAAVGRRRLKPEPGGDSAMARAYSEAGVDGTYAEVAVYEEVAAGSKPDAVHGEGSDSDSDDADDYNHINMPSSSRDLALIMSAQIQLGGKLGESEFFEVKKGVWRRRPWDSRPTNSYEFPPGATEIPVAVKTTRNIEDNIFKEEINRLNQLDHPFVVLLLGVMFHPNPAMVLELCAMGTLLSYLPKNKSRLLKADGGQTLVLFAAQIAKGMVYLEQKRMVLRDLNARNILVKDEHTVKISCSNFSARCMEIHDKFHDEFSRARDRVRWWAPETAFYGKYTPEANAWSFGVTCWEIWSFGDVPYGDWMGREVLEFIERGERLPNPAGCPTPVYEIMCSCWEFEMAQRIKFTDAFEQLKALLPRHLLSRCE